MSSVVCFVLTARTRPITTQNPNKLNPDANMKFFATIMGTALVATGVSAQQAVVKNNCATSIYVQSFPFDGSAAGTLTTLAAGQSYSETFKPSGSVSLPGLKY